MRSACLSILEVGGAFAHRFRSLVEFLGLVALVITDLDSVARGGSYERDDDESTEFEIPNTEANQPPIHRVGKACVPSEENAVTSNQTLIQWLPGKQRVADLLDTPGRREIVRCRERLWVQGPRSLSNSNRRDVEWLQCQHLWSNTGGSVRPGKRSILSGVRATPSWAEDPRNPTDSYRSFGQPSPASHWKGV